MQPIGSQAMTTPTSAPLSAKERLANAVNRRDWVASEKVASEALMLFPEDPDVLKAAAISAGQNGRLREAAALITDAIDKSVELDSRQIQLAIKANIEVGQVYEAIDLIESVLSKHPDANSLRRVLVGLLGEAQRVERIPMHMKCLIQNRAFDAALLEATTESSTRRFSLASIETVARLNPTDKRILLGKAKQHFDSAEFNAAEQVLNEVLDQHPEFSPAIAMLAHLHGVLGNQAELERLIQSSSLETQRYADFWIGVGLARSNAKLHRACVLAFANATRLRPDDVAGWRLLAGAIREMQTKPDEASRTTWNEEFDSIERRIERLITLKSHFFAFAGSQRTDASAANAVAVQLKLLGRLWEAEAWSAIAVQLSKPPSLLFEKNRQSILRLLTKTTTWHDTTDQLELTFDLSRLEESSEPHDAAASPTNKFLDTASARPLAVSRPLTLRNVANDYGLDFIGKVGDRVHGPNVPLSQSLGCGGAAFDYDLDGQCDLVFAAAGGAINERDSQPSTLFRNTGSALVSVIASSGVDDRGYGQGIVTGDYNQDGFPDLMILNFGENRLLRNNGDGTFADVTVTVGMGGDRQWSTSGLMMDVDGDGLLDVVCVNYIDASEPTAELCRNSAGKQAPCLPIAFAAAADQFWKGQPDGSFLDVSQNWTSDLVPQRGLGIVGGRLDGVKPSLFIANDMSANHHFRLQLAETSLKLKDTAMLDGLALDGRGHAQASMGIAVDDIDNDGKLDLYVTGFAGEYNVFYQQQASGTWSDRTAAMKAVAETLPMVGFGVQSVDFDRDGRKEIFVANGHISDFGEGYPPYAQPAQVFRQDGKTFQAIETSGEIGVPRVGRAAFLADVSGDHWPEVVVTNATSPVCIWQDAGTTDFHWIALTLVGTQSSRDAVGTYIDLSIETPSNTKAFRRIHQISGGGYLASNQAVQFVALGEATNIDDATIHWSSGNVQSLKNLTVDTHQLLVEGQSPVRLD